MANICFVHNALEKNNLKLEHPTGIKGGAYLSTISNSDNAFYLQMPKCMMRNGIVKTEKKKYCDLMFNNTDSYVVSWFENLETIIQDLIYEKKTLWFNGEIEMSDIEETFINIIKTYRSGNNYLVRCLLPKDISSVLCYNENEETIALDKIVSEETLMIPLVEIANLRFTSRNFQVDIILREIMIVTEDDSDDDSDDSDDDTDPDDSNDESDNDNENEDNNQTNKKEVDSKEIQLNINEDSSIKLNIESIENSKNQENNGNQENKQNANITVKKEKPVITEAEMYNQNDENENVSEESSIIKAEMEVNNTNDLITEDSKTNNSEGHKSQSPQLKLNTTSIIESQKNETPKNETPKANNLEEVSLNLDTLDDSNSISLKSPQTVYYAIWQNAKQRLKFHRNEALKAFLDAKNIKNTYLVDQIDNDSEDEFKM